MRVSSEEGIPSLWRVTWEEVGAKGKAGKGSRNASRVPFGNIKAHVAQLVEHVLGKDEVTRSIRVVGSILLSRIVS